MKCISKVDPSLYRSGYFLICQFLNILEDRQHRQERRRISIQLHGKVFGGKIRDERVQMITQLKI